MVLRQHQSGHRCPLLTNELPHRMDFWTTSSPLPRATTRLRRPSPLVLRRRGTRSQETYIALGRRCSTCCVTDSRLPTLRSKKTSSGKHNNNFEHLFATTEWKIEDRGNGVLLMPPEQNWDGKRPCFTRVLEEGEQSFVVIHGNMNFKHRPLKSNVGGRSWSWLHGALQPERGGASHKLVSTVQVGKETNRARFLHPLPSIDSKRGHRTSLVENYHNAK